MPTIELHGDADDRAWLLAVMLFPSDDRNRLFAFARQKVAASVHEVEDNEELVLDAKTIRTLLAAPSASEFQSIKERATRSGLIAGDILAMVYLMAEVIKTPMPSVNKAVHAYLAWAKSGSTWGDGKPLPTSESVIRAAWASHRAVSHLWAAVRLNEAYPFAERGQIFGAGWDSFLGVAVGLFAFGSEFVPQRMKPPAAILNHADCWRLPDSIPPRKLVTSRLPDALIGLLKGYKAPQPLA